MTYPCNHIYLINLRLNLLATKYLLQEKETIVDHWGKQCLPNQFKLLENWKNQKIYQYIYLLIYIFWLSEIVIDLVNTYI